MPSWWAEGVLESDGVTAITKAKLPSPRRAAALWIFIKSSTIRKNLICQFNYKAGAREGFSLDLVSLGDSASFPDSHIHRAAERKPFDRHQRKTFPLLLPNVPRRTNESGMRGGNPAEEQRHYYSSAQPIMLRKQAISPNHKWGQQRKQSYWGWRWHSWALTAVKQTQFPNQEGLKPWTLRSQNIHAEQALFSDVPWKCGCLMKGCCAHLHHQIQLKAEVLLSTKSGERWPCPFRRVLSAAH